MITKFSITNFKSLHDFSIDLEHMACLIGVNNSGKTTILQALDFVSAVANGNVGAWLRSREWNFRDIRTKYSGKQKAFLITFLINFNIDNKKYSWSCSFNTNSFLCASECFKNELNDENLLIVENRSYKIEKNENKLIDQLYEGSIISSLIDNVLTEELIAIKNFVKSIKSLELLNPLMLRKRARTSDGDLGLGGEKLSAFLSGIGSKKFNRLNSKIKSIFSNYEQFFIRSKISGWKELWILEKFGNNDAFVTEARHISDGFLRIIAILSQLETENSVLLFDEIEDGVNQEVMEELVEILIKSEKQIIFTTHSPMLLNYIDDDTAKNSVMLIYRDKKTGETKSCKFYSIDKIKDKLEYMGPGEIFANVNLKELP